MLTQDTGLRGRRGGQQGPRELATCSGKPGRVPSGPSSSVSQGTEPRGGGWGRPGLCLRGAKGHPFLDTYHTPGAALGRSARPFTLGLCFTRPGNRRPEDEVTAQGHRGTGSVHTRETTLSHALCEPLRGRTTARQRCWDSPPTPLPDQHQEPGTPAEELSPGSAQIRVPSSPLPLSFPERSLPPQIHPLPASAPRAANHVCGSLEKPKWPLGSTTAMSAAFPLGQGRLGHPLHLLRPGVGATAPGPEPSTQRTPCRAEPQLKKLRSKAR